MKITRVEATPLYIELNIDILDVNKTNGLSVVLVEVETNEGHTGHGITAIMDEGVVASAREILRGFDPSALWPSSFDGGGVGEI